MKLKHLSAERGSTLLQWKWNLKDKFVQCCNTPTCSLSKRREMDSHSSKTCVWHTHTHSQKSVLVSHRLNVVYKQVLRNPHAKEQSGWAGWAHNKAIQSRKCKEIFIWVIWISKHHPSFLTLHLHTHKTHWHIRPYGAVQSLSLWCFPLFLQGWELLLIQVSAEPPASSECVSVCMSVCETV